MIYKIIYGSAPSYSSNLYKKLSDIHDRCTRNSSLNIPKCRAWPKAHLGTEVQKSGIVFQMS